MESSSRLYRRPDPFVYRLARIASFLVATFFFRRRFLRNELKHVKGPCVVIANHQASLDFVNLIGATKRPCTFVISNSFYHSLPIRPLFDRMHVIPKQQFQTSVMDLKKMKAVIDSGQILVIYPAGLMCEDGLSTPIPSATYKFLKWIRADIYMARTSGTYFAMPKWSRGIRAGRTYMDIYKLFDRDELASMDLGTVREITDRALLFDAYREQEKLHVRFARGNDIRGLENVLYECPHCDGEFTMQVREKRFLRCARCGYEEESDLYGLLHPVNGSEPGLRYVSDWSRRIFRRVKDTLRSDPAYRLSAPTEIQMIDPEKNRFEPVGKGTVTLEKGRFRLEGTIRGESVDLSISTAGVPTLPFRPGKQIELQDGPVIYRCVLEDGRLSMKYIYSLKAFYELASAE